jgi:hypothetical protein
VKGCEEKRKADILMFIDKKYSVNLNLNQSLMHSMYN